MRRDSWEILTDSWDRAQKEKTRLEKATLIFFEDIMRDDWEVCSKLIERGCSPNMSLGQKTASMVACEYGSLQVLRLLTRTGANLSAQDEQGRDVVFWALENRSVEVLNFLLDQPLRLKRLFYDNSTPLIEAAKSGFVYGVQALVRFDPLFINAYDRMGRTALWHVLSKEPMTSDDNEIARILLDAGADPEITDLEGVSPREAAASAQKDLVEALIQANELSQTLENQPDPAPQSPSPSRTLRL